jgi:hypothetical protein
VKHLISDRDAFPCPFPAKLSIIVAWLAKAFDLATFFVARTVPKIFFPCFSRAAGKASPRLVEKF